MSQDAAEAQAILARGSKSFSFAARFLPADARADAARVYAFCRYVDDVADDVSEAETVRLASLRDLRLQVEGAREAQPAVAGLLDVNTRRGLDLEAALHLIEGCASDVRRENIADDDALLRYCYQVASTVGLLMCGVLQVREAKALPFAVDLGIAMQLTNICRDVAEDAREGRVYLPSKRLRAAGVDPRDLLAGTADRAAVAQVVRDLLELAETYYQSAWRGMHFLPRRARLAVVVAARVYRRIGRDLLSRGGNALAGRTVVPWPSKVIEALHAVLWFLGRPFVDALKAAQHQPGLHHALVGLPGADGS